MPGAPAGVDRSAIDEFATPRQSERIARPPPSGASQLISLLDLAAPYVQAFDLVLMVVAGIFCLRARKAPGLTILALSCFVSAVILLGFFLFGVLHGQAGFPQVAYIVARLLAPFELLLFAVGLILVARHHRRS
jgi:hypothetical protein